MTGITTTLASLKPLTVALISAVSLKLCYHFWFTTWWRRGQFQGFPLGPFCHIHPHCSGREPMGVCQLVSTNLTINSGMAVGGGGTTTAWIWGPQECALSSLKPFGANWSPWVIIFKLTSETAVNLYYVILTKLDFPEFSSLLSSVNVGHKWHFV